MNTPNLEHPPIIMLRGLSKQFKKRTKRRRFGFLGGWEGLLGQKKRFFALEDVNLEVPRGEMLGVIGMNGSGKSTLLKLIAGLSFPSAGEIRVQGSVGSLIELGAGFHPDLTGYQNVYLSGSILGFRRSEMDDLLPKIVEFSELEGFMAMPVKHFSSGMFVRLAFSIAIQLRPDILLLDETLAVGDVGFQSKAIEAIQSFHDTGATILMVSHDIYAVREYCSRAIWLHEGRVRMTGKSRDVAEAYRDFLSERGGHRAQNLLAMHGHELFSESPVSDPPIQITGIEIHDSNGLPIEKVSRPKWITISIAYRCTQTVEKLRVCVAVVQHESGAVSVEKDTQREGQDLGAFEGEGVIRFSFAAEQFCRNTFGCIAAFYDPSRAGTLWSRCTKRFELDGLEQPRTEHAKYLMRPCETLEHLPRTDA